MLLKSSKILGFLNVTLFLGIVLQLPPYSVALAQGNPQPLKVVIAMLDSIKKIKTYEFELKALERVEKGEYLTAESKVKLLVSPRTLYFRNEKKKISVMYIAGANDNKAFVKAKMLFNTTLSLDPYGSMMRKNQHYTINELGYDYFARTLGNALLKDKEHISQNLKFIGRKVIGGQSCIGIAFEDPDFQYFEYTTQKGDNIASLAQKFNVAEFQIRLKNDLTGHYGNLKAGRELKIPSNYCKKIYLYLSEATLLPVSITIYDDVGLYENYEYSNIKTNQIFTPSDFAKFYKD